MTIVEITSRYEGNAGLAREWPADAEDAQLGKEVSDRVTSGRHAVSTD